MNTRKIAGGGLMLAFGLVLPQIFHLSGIPQSGSIFLPMHIPVIMGGMLWGPVMGILLGVLCPVFSALLTGMPAMARLPYMVCELAVYGLSAGLFYQTFGLCRKRGGIYLSLLIAMCAGRLAYGISLFTTLHILGVKNGGVMTAVTATTTGIPGILLQLIFIPVLVYSVQIGGILREYSGTGSNHNE